jgi:hypothetical protein
MHVLNFFNDSFLYFNVELLRSFLRFNFVKKILFNYIIC